MAEAIGIAAAIVQFVDIGLRAYLKLDRLASAARYRREHSRKPPCDTPVSNFDRPDRDLIISLHRPNQEPRGATYCSHKPEN
ncbi:hypothetical protein BPOR_0787g00060 [Botrytis porri]|uniref:Uncharacterized protein n=1 Tax=Botrytis porri TaxID=87229 RepID=A0A4Z1KB82_9HELO|nr:hypothetical protein BPOR_0787g00060 [Botrytis porri]